jgi:osmoprotectant transport system substrate-binding protein
VIRKHTRRAAKAAFAVSFGVALLLGLAACGGDDGGGGDKSTPVVIGTKNFTEQFILGQLYKQALEADGYSVTYKENIGSSELIDTALTSGEINFYPEYTGVIVLNIAGQESPDSAEATYDAAKEFEEGRGMTLLNMTPFADADSFTVLKTTADEHGLTTIADVKKIENPSYAGYPECRTRPTCLLGLKNVYGLTNLKFVAIGSIPVTKLIDDGTVTGGDIFTTEPALADDKYVVLEDTEGIFGFQNVAPVVSQELVDALGDDFVSIVNSVSEKLTTEAMIAMNKAVGVDKKLAADVAREFLEANDLL